MPDHDDTHHHGDNCPGGHADQLPPLPPEWTCSGARDVIAGEIDGALLDRQVHAQAIIEKLYAAGYTLGKPDEPDTERYRGMLIALEAECSTLTDGLQEHSDELTALRAENTALAAALTAVTHEYTQSRLDHDWCGECGRLPAEPEHRTPARVRAEHGIGTG